MDANTWLWVLAGFLALLFVGTGVLKLTRSREDIVAAGLGWAEEYAEPTLRLLGAAEVLGAAGLVLPPLVGLGILVPITASALAVLTLGGVLVHVRRRELLPDALRTLVLSGLCILLAAYRFGPQAF